jgi:hypothetical protein
MINGRLVTYSKHNLGTIIEDCGTPCFISVREEMFSLVTEFLLSLSGLFKRTLSRAVDELNHEFVAIRMLFIWQESVIFNTISFRETEKYTT